MDSIKFQKLHPDAVLPTRAHATDAGMDIVATSINETDMYIEYGTGLAVEIDPGYVGLLVPRSSVTKYDLMLKNAVGVIDSEFRGQMTARFAYSNRDNSDFKKYNVGDKVAQLVIVPISLPTPQWADELTDTNRGTGGYGSTGQ